MTIKPDLEAAFRAAVADAFGDTIIDPRSASGIADILWPTFRDQGWAPHSAKEDT